MAKLGKYQLVAEIARGGMGIVYLAVSHGPARFSKLLVVKELKADLVDDPTFLEMFLEEARLAARLSHPNIVQTYEIGAEGNRHYIVMDYLEGVPLARVLRKKNESFKLNMQLRTMCEILQGLDYAHSLSDFDGTPLGIVHRDATPQNVFITFDGTVKLVDFGIAKALDSTVETRTGVLKGKPAYMAPEQIAGEVDPRADVFSVGVMVWEAVVGRRMWHKKGDIEVITHILKGEIPTLRETMPDAPPALIRICDRALAKNRDERYPTASDFQADLEAYLVSTKTDISSREVGKVVAELFAAERASTRAVVEQHIATLKAGKVADKLPSLRPPGPESLSTPSGQVEGVNLRLADPPSFTTASSHSQAGTPPGTEVSSRAAALAGGGKRRRRAMIGLAAAGALGLGGLLLLQSASSRKIPLGSGTPALVASGAAAPPLPVTHEISLRASPSSALLSIEGVPLPNPGRRTCTHGQRLLLRVSAAHFVASDRELRCEQDETIELALQPEPIASTVAPAAAAPPTWVPAPRRPAVAATPQPATAHPPADPTAKPATSAPTRPSDVTTGGTRPTRPIDTASPYGSQ